MRGAAPSGISRNPAHWRGCIDTPRVAGVVSTAHTAARAEPCDLWIDYIVPTYDQGRLPSCCGHAWANGLEPMLRRYVSRNAIPPGYQLDGEAAWRRGVELFQGGDLTSGLTLEDGFRACVSLGWLPADAALLYIPSDWDSCARALRLYPLIQGSEVHDGWFHPAPENGCIDHGYTPGVGRGHATVQVGCVRHPGVDGMTHEWRVSLNSWGADYGRNGLFVMLDSEWQEGSFLTGPVAAHIPDYRTWRGWEKGLIRTPEERAA